MNAAPIRLIVPRLPFWAKLSPEEQAIVSERAVVKHFEKGQLVSSNSSECLGIVFILEGEIRVSMTSDEGREVTLYHARKNETCVSTASCVIQQLTFETAVVAEKETSLLVVPASICAKLMNSNIHVRAFVFERETERFSQAIWAIQQMLFKRFDQRLASYLVLQFEKNGAPEIKKTQEEIARDVNSAREVVARMLKDFSDTGLVEIKRGAIKLLDIDGLKKRISAP